MDFTLNEEQRMFAETARTLLGDTCTPDHWHKMMEQGVAFDAGRWAQIAENGFTLLLLPESAGGLGLTELDFALIAIEAGYVALPEPFAESAGIGAPLLASLAPEHPALADPAAIIAVAPQSNPVVANADMAAAILIEKDGHAFVTTPKQVTLTPVETIDPLRRLFRIEWDASQVEDLGKADWALAFDRAALFAAAQGLGLAQRAVDLAVAYAKERTQFGKPIGSYQAVKHHLASAQTAIEFARPVVFAAAADIGHADIHSRARVSHARIFALEAAEQAARASIQVHGAMGYSWEVDVHLFLKRTLALKAAWGTPADHRARVADRLFRHPAGAGQTFVREDEHA
jgi:alkylation response protein AidB-like acyl-CoA dehydrogenase